MTFLAPSFLWGLLALAIPVIVHLFNFRKTRRIYFSSNRFLRKLQKEESPRRKLKEWLILASRLLALFFLVMAFAQPFIPTDGDAVARPQFQAVYIDNSYSMLSRLNENITGLAAATDLAFALKEAYPADQDYLLETNAFRDGYPMNGYQFEERLTELAFQPVVRSFEEITSRLNRITPPKSNIFFFGDFQKSTYGLLNSQLDSQKTLQVVPILYDRPSNIYVDSLFLEELVLNPGDQQRLRVRVVNSGTEEKPDVLLRLIINDIQVGNASVSLAPGGRKELVFNIGPDLASSNRGMVQIEDFPVTFDNNFHFVLNINAPPRVVEIRGEKAPSVLAKVYGNKEAFVFRSFEQGNIDFSYLNQADVIFLHGIASWSEALETRMAQLAEDQTLICYIPSSLQPQSSLLRFFGVEWQTDSLSQQSLAEPDYQHPFFTNVFEAESQRITMPEAQPVVQLPQVADPVLSFSTGNAYFAATRPGQQIYALASPLQIEYTNFSRHALFVPVMYKLALTAGQQQIPLYYTLGDVTLRYAIDTIRGTDVIKLVKDEQELIPSRRVIQNELLLEVPAGMLSPGFYRLVINEESVRYLAFNYAKAESQMSQYDLGEIKSALALEPGVNVIEDWDITNFDRTLREISEGIPLWKWAIVACLFFIAVEIALIRWM